MKNIKYLLLIIPFLFLTSVKAEEHVYYLPTGDKDNYSFNLNEESSIYTYSFVDKYIKEMVKEWEEKYKNDWPYYVISVFNNMPDDFDFTIALYVSKSISSSLVDNSTLFHYGIYEGISRPGVFRNFKEGVLVDSDSHIGIPTPYISWRYYIDGNASNTDPSNIGRYYFLSSYYDSNFDFPYGRSDTLIVKNGEETLFTLDSPTDIVPTYKSKFVDSDLENYVTVDLNNYAYVALSLKDYNKTEEFTSMSYVKGQYCLTSVYNYGLTERKDILTGTQMQRCSLYYDNYTPIRTNILKSDLENHSIYYLKAYDTSKENKIKVDTSVFNIHYITEEEKDNPVLTINGKKYTPIPYDELTDTATKSEDENYASGGSCAVGDFNCTASLSGSKVSWSDIFTSPLDFLRNIWTSITRVFEVINHFISILPVTLQYFFYISFMLAIILGIIKIIL